MPGISYLVSSTRQISAHRYLKLTRVSLTVHFQPPTRATATQRLLGLHGTTYEAIDIGSTWVGEKNPHVERRRWISTTTTFIGVVRRSRMYGHEREFHNNTSLVHSKQQYGLELRLAKAS